MTRYFESIGCQSGLISNINVATWYPDHLPKCAR